jgi:hypothetical protein
MRASQRNGRPRPWRKLAAGAATGMLALSLIGGGTASAADSRDYSVTVSTPTAVSQGAATKFDITVQSWDNQTIANVHLSVPDINSTIPWPTGITIATVFGPNASMCSWTATSVSCDFGNLSAFGVRKISVLASVASTVPTGSSITFSASAETNNENGANIQVESGTSAPLQVLAFNPNSVTTANLGGSAGTSALGTSGAGNLQTALSLLQDNGGNGNVIVITEGTSTTQPAVCVSLKLTCQPDFADVTVNAGAAISPYLETVITANVPKTYNIKKAFVIHLETEGSLTPGFPLYNVSSTSCIAHPALVPCADFSLSKTNVLTITIHTATNGKFQF